jgi:hypothetical protein
MAIKHLMGRQWWQVWNANGKCPWLKCILMKQIVATYALKQLNMGGDFWKQVIMCIGETMF